MHPLLQFVIDYFQKNPAAAEQVLGVLVAYLTKNPDAIATIVNAVAGALAPKQPTLR